MVLEHFEYCENGNLLNHIESYVVYIHSAGAGTTFWTKKINQLYLVQGCGRDTHRQAVLYSFINHFEGTSLLSFET